MDKLPEELVEEIFAVLIGNIKELAEISRTSRKFHRIAERFLYHTVCASFTGSSDLDDIPGSQLLVTLNKRPELRQYVKKLVATTPATSRRCSGEILVNRMILERDQNVYQTKHILHEIVAILPSLESLNVAHYSPLFERPIRWLDLVSANCQPPYSMNPQLDFSNLKTLECNLRVCDYSDRLSIFSLPNIETLVLHNECFSSSQGPSPEMLRAWQHLKSTVKHLFFPNMQQNPFETGRERFGHQMPLIAKSCPLLRSLRIIWDSGNLSSSKSQSIIRLFTEQIIAGDLRQLEIWQSGPIYQYSGVYTSFEQVRLHGKLEELDIDIESLIESSELPFLPYVVRTLDLRLPSTLRCLTLRTYWLEYLSKRDYTYVDTMNVAHALKQLANSRLRYKFPSLECFTLVQKMSYEPSIRPRDVYDLEEAFKAHGVQFELRLE